MEATAGRQHTHDTDGGEDSKRGRGVFYNQKVLGENPCDQGQPLLVDEYQGHLLGDAVIDYSRWKPIRGFGSSGFLRGSLTSSMLIWLTC